MRSRVLVFLVYWMETFRWRNIKHAREATPLWVWIVFVLMGVGVIAYVAGVFMIEDIIAFVK